MQSRTLLRASFTLALLVLAASAARAPTYDALCDEMVNYAQLAAKAHNSGSEEEAKVYAAKVEASYKVAKAKDAKHPQAHLNFATFLMNSNRFDEALPLFELAEKAVGNNMQAKGQIMTNMRKCKYGKMSMERDRLYDGGKGDIYAALEAGEAQLDASPEPYRTNHDLATMSAMLCEYDESQCEAAARRFRMAHFGTSQLYRTYKTPQGDQAKAFGCRNSNIYAGSWARHRRVATKTLVEGKGSSKHGGVYLHTLQAPSQLLGRDGVVTVTDDAADCTLFSPASDYYLNMADNVIPKGMPPQQLVIDDVPVIDLIQFAGNTFYHWLCEAVPRLVMAKKALGSVAKYKLLVPRSTPSTPFVLKSLELIFSNNEEYALAEYVPFAKVNTELSFVAWDQQPCPHEDAAPTYTASRACAALAHPAALRAARDALVAGVENGPFASYQPPDPLIIFASRGDNVTMRKIDEWVIVEKIKAFLRDNANEVGSHRFEIFDGKAGLTEALAMFRKAKVVIGVHGGALSNAIACPAGSGLIEIGFAADAAQHYQHLATSLAMRYRRVTVTKDNLGRALGAPTVRASADAVVAALGELLFDAAGKPDAARASAPGVFRRDPPAAAAGPSDEL